LINVRSRFIELITSSSIIPGDVKYNIVLLMMISESLYNVNIYSAFGFEFAGILLVQCCLLTNLLSLTFSLFFKFGRLESFRTVIFMLTSKKVL
jgi:hypothetical protein